MFVVVCRANFLLDCMGRHYVVKGVDERVMCVYIAWKYTNGNDQSVNHLYSFVYALLRF